METKEIEKKIRELENKIREDRDIIRQRASLLAQLRDVKQKEFEAKLGVKPGDIITTRTGRPYYYENFSTSCGTLTIICHTVKKNGMPSWSTRLLPVDWFLPK